MPLKENSLRPWAVGLGAALFYLCFHSRLYNIDGVACAIAVELGDYKHLVHGNHLLYGLAGRAYYLIWQALGYKGRALLPLTVLDSVLGGAGVGIFSAILARLGLKGAAAWAGELGLGLSAAWWLWSLEAQVYMLGCFFLLLAVLEILREHPSPARLGLFHAAAILGHVGHAAFFPAALWALSHKSPGVRGQGSGVTKGILVYAGAALAVLIAAYLGAGLALIRPRSLHELELWLWGSAALGRGRSFAWHGGYTLAGLKLWLLSSLRIFAGPVAPGNSPSGSSWALDLFLIAAAVLGASAKVPASLLTGPERRLRIKPFLFLWLASYALLYLSWEPGTLVYRISDLPALWILIAMAAARQQGLTLPGRRLAAAFPAAALVLGIHNWLLTIRPAQASDANPLHAEALWIGRSTPENAWIAADGSVYIGYFAGRRVLDIGYHGQNPAAWRRALLSLPARDPVYVPSRVAADPRYKSLFQGLDLFAASEGGGDILYRITTAPSPRGRGRKN